MLEESFTDCQQKAARKIQSFLDHQKLEDSETMVLTGPAGSGKTYMLKYIIKTNKANFNFIGLAPTHKARRVLQESIGQICKTYHRQLSVKQYYEVDGTSVFKPDKEKWNLYDNDIGKKILIIDECSMISDEEYKWIMSYIRTVGASVIFVGDSCQLHAVNNEKDGTITVDRPSMVFTEKHDYDEVELSEVCRSTNEDINKMFHLFRMATVIEPLSTPIRFIRKNDCGHIYVHNNYKTFTRYMNDLYIIKREAKNGFEIGVIACSNKRVAHYNKYIYEQIYNKQFKAGDEFVFNRYCMLLNEGKTIIHYSSDSLKLLDYKTDVIVSSDYFDDQFKCVKFWFSDGPYILEANCIYDEEEKKRFDKVVSAKRNQIKKSFYNPPLLIGNKKVYTKSIKDEEIQSSWKEFNLMKNSINAPIISRMAMTTYKSQGSTFELTFVDLQDIIDCRGKDIDSKAALKEIYTSISRCRSQCHVLLYDSTLPTRDFPRYEPLYKCVKCKRTKNEDNFRIKKSGIMNKTCNSCLEKSKR